MRMGRGLNNVCSAAEVWRIGNVGQEFQGVDPFNTDPVGGCGAGSMLRLRFSPG